MKDIELKKLQLEVRKLEVLKDILIASERIVSSFTSVQDLIVKSHPIPKEEIVKPTKSRFQTKLEEMAKLAEEEKSKR